MTIQSLFQATVSFCKSCQYIICAASASVHSRKFSGEEYITHQLKSDGKHCSNERPVRLYHHHLVCSFTLASRKKQNSPTLMRCFWWHIVHAEHLNSQNKSNYNNLTAASASEEHKDDSATLQTSEAALHLRVQRHHQSCRAISIALFLSFSPVEEEARLQLLLRLWDSDLKKTQTMD